MFNKKKQLKAPIKLQPKVRALGLFLAFNYPGFDCDSPHKCNASQRRVKKSVSSH